MPPESKDAAAALQPDWLAAVAAFEESSELDTFWAERPDLQRRETISLLTQEVARLARREPPVAERLSRAASRLAHLIGDAYGHALADKSNGHLRFLVGDYEEALRLYRSCQKNFFDAGAEIEAAVNLGSSMWMLALLGRYEEAWDDSRQAHEVLDGHADPVLLARVVTNEGNIFLRQDRHHEALDRYRSALELFRQAGEIQDIAVTLHNIAVSSIAISDFVGALESYRELTVYCREHDLALLAAQADYNIAYLYFFRGEYSRAIEIYQQTRRQCELLGDDYHLALCDLDQAEIYLELNLSDDATRLAKLAHDAFERRGNGYEAAKAITFLAIAAGRRGDPLEALDGFSRARARFEAEHNAAWVAMTEFYRALMHHQLSNPRAAREMCAASREFFDGVAWQGRVALCDLLLAQIDLQEGKSHAARHRCRTALEALEGLELPALSLKGFVALGQVEEALGNRASALEAYRRAHLLLEDLRTHLGSEESKISFLSDKLVVYESLVHMTLRDSTAPENLEVAFVYIEQAKSRILADLVLSRGSDLRSGASDNPDLVDQVRRLRSELSQAHHELDQLYSRRASSDRDLEERVHPSPSADGAGAALAARGFEARIETMKAEGRKREHLLMDTIQELRARDSKFAAILSTEVAPLESIRASIPFNAILVEYFESRGVTYACVLGARSLEIKPLCEAASLSAPLSVFINQMSKHQLGEDYLKRFGEKTERTARACLKELYSALVEPIEALLDCEQLVIVPHGILHQVPFHALVSGEDYLLDRFVVSYAPSASLFAALQDAPECDHRNSLVFGVPDARAPEILEEVRAVSDLLPNSSLFVGEEATEARLRSLAPESRIVHIATHGFFRRDSPMFSAIQLGGSRLTLLDLYSLELGAELVVLSGCSTGLHKIESGDELIGLSRGLLYAGAQALVTSLWDVHDRSTAAFMKSFYRHLGACSNRAEALKLAILDVRADFPSPYHWAPFVLIGKYVGSAPLV